MDGVAPRAKMNQQRSRRFRSAKESEEAEKKARQKGEELPKEKKFDSNVITPGTGFMCRLDAQLRYFINDKVSRDDAWRGIQVRGWNGHLWRNYRLNDVIILKM